jgi:hypothetical protein
MRAREQAFEPVQRGVRIGERRAGGLVRAFDHDDGNSEGSRGGDLGVGFGAARVLGDEHVDALALHECVLSFEVEWRALSDESDAWRQCDVAGGIDGAGDVVMLWSRCEGGQLQAADGEQNAAGLISKRGGGTGGVGDDYPGVACDRQPGFAANGAERQSEGLRGRDGIGGNVNRVGMRGIDDGVHSLMIKPAGEAVRAAETADAGCDGLLRGLARAAGEREHRLETRVRGEEPAQLARFARAA